MHSNLLVVGNFQQSVIPSQYNFSNWPKVPVNPQIPQSVDAVVMIAGSVSSATAKDLIDLCNVLNLPVVYTDSALNDLNSKLENAQKKIEAALDEEAANDQVVNTTEVKEQNMAAKKNVKKSVAKKNARHSAAKKVVAPEVVKSETTNTTETPKESNTMNTAATQTSTPTQNSFNIVINPGETHAQALARTLKELSPDAVITTKEDRRKTGANTQNAQKKADFVRELFKKDPSMKTDDVHAAIVKEFKRGLTPSEIHKIRKEFGVAYVGRGKLVNVNDLTPVQPSGAAAPARQAPSYIDEPRGSIEIGSPPDERVWTAVENLKAELGLVSLRVDEKGIDYVVQMKGHVERH